MQEHLRIASRLAKLLDSEFKFFKWRFGLDPILGLVPGGGDLISFLLSVYIIWIASQMQVPKDRLAEMIVNSVLDLFVGAIPVVGDIGDFALKSNSKNIAILNDHARLPSGESKPS